MARDCACVRVRSEVGHAEDLQPLGDFGAEKVDEMGRRRASAEPEPHPRGHELQRGTGGPPLSRVRGLAFHGKRLGCGAAPVNP